MESTRADTPQPRNEDSYRRDLYRLLLAHGIYIEKSPNGGREQANALLDKWMNHELLFVSTKEGLQCRERYCALDLYFSADGRLMHLLETGRIVNGVQYATTTMGGHTLLERIKLTEPSQSAISELLWRSFCIDDHNCHHTGSVRWQMESEETILKGLTTIVDKEIFKGFVSGDQYNPEGYRIVSGDTIVFYEWVPIPLLSGNEVS